MIITRPDGTKRYYYYKKKKGRHKKTGPKKKKVVNEKKYKHFEYKILKCDFRKQDKYIGIFHDAEEVEIAKKILQEKNDQVIFPKQYINNGRNDSKVYEYKSEYIILKRNHDENSDGITQVRNDFGKLVDHKTSSNKWLIVDKFPCLTEEEFWVYGYNPKLDRKTFAWIYDNFINNMIKTNYDIVNIYVLVNKVIFRYELGSLNFVICKNQSDAIRMYNLIENLSKKNKQVIMTGYATNKSDRGKELIEIICEKTGWTKTKLLRKSTRH